MINHRTYQFADDMIIIADAHSKTLRGIKATLQPHADLTRLSININKSVFVPIAVPTRLRQIIQVILGCQQ
jgi:hypothetical protein